MIKSNNQLSNTHASGFSIQDSGVAWTSTQKGLDRNHSLFVYCCYYYMMSSFLAPSPESMHFLAPHPGAAGLLESGLRGSGVVQMDSTSKDGISWRRHFGMCSLWLSLSSLYNFAHGYCKVDVEKFLSYFMEKLGQNVPGDVRDSISFVPHTVSS